MTEHLGISCCQMKIAEDPNGMVRPVVRGDGERKQVSLSHHHRPDLNPGWLPSAQFPGVFILKGEAGRACSQGGSSAGCGPSEKPWFLSLVSL